MGNRRGKREKKAKRAKKEEDSGKPETGKKITKHHVTPRSRGGTNNDVVLIPNRYHEAWHIFFGNLTSQEAVHFIRVVFPRKESARRGKMWTSGQLYALQLEIQRKTEQQKAEKA
jgi:hypothetical protein